MKKSKILFHTLWLIPFLSAHYATASTYPIKCTMIAKLSHRKNNRIKDSWNDSNCGFDNQGLVFVGGKDNSGSCSGYYGKAFEIGASFIENSQGYLLTVYKPQLSGVSEKLTTFQFSPSSYTSSRQDLPVNQVIYQENARRTVTLDTVDVSCTIESATLLGKFARDNDIPNFKNALANFPETEHLDPTGPIESKNARIIEALRVAQAKDNVDILKAAVEAGYKNVFIENDWTNPLVDALDYGPESLKYLASIFPDFLKKADFNGTNSSALHAAINRGLADKVSLLVTLGINPNSEVSNYYPSGFLDTVMNYVVPLEAALDTEASWPVREQMILDLLSVNAAQGDPRNEFDNFLNDYLRMRADSCWDSKPNLKVVQQALAQVANFKNAPLILEHAMGFTDFNHDADLFQRSYTEWDETAKIVALLIAAGADVNQDYPLVRIASFNDPDAIKIAKMFLDHHGNLKKVYETRYWKTKITACDRASAEMLKLFTQYGGCH